MSACIKVMLRTFKSKTNFCCSSVVSTSGYNDRSFHFKNFYRSLSWIKRQKFFTLKTSVVLLPFHPVGKTTEVFMLKTFLVYTTTEIFHLKNFCRSSVVSPSGYNDRSFRLLKKLLSFFCCG